MLPRFQTLEITRPAPPSSGEVAARSVLIADHDPPELTRVRDALALRGFGLLTAQDGAEALSVIRNHRPDVVLLRKDLPHLSGVEVCRILKASPEQGGLGFIPLILIADREDSGALDSLDAGADDVLLKPFDVPELSARVRSMLRVKALQEELERTREALVALSRTDPLTDLLNRRSFEERFAEEFARSKRYRVPLSCVLFDIDHFKRINDSRGTPVGDRVLQSVARLARETLRDVDLLARYGGAEFVALLPETGAQDARRVAERIRYGIERLSLHELRCTASLGLATFPVPGIDSGEALLRAAGDCLDVARERGRNRVVQFLD